MNVMDEDVLPSSTGKDANGRLFTFSTRKKIKDCLRKFLNSSIQFVIGFFSPQLPNHDDDRKTTHGVSTLILNN